MSFIYIIKKAKRDGKTGQKRKEQLMTEKDTDRKWPRKYVEGRQLTIKEKVGKIPYKKKKKKIFST